MSSKTYNLITGIITGLESGSLAIITYIQPSCAVALTAAIPIAGTAILSICKLFVKADSE